MKRYLLLFALLALVACAPAQAQPDPMMRTDPRTVHVVGESTAHVEPDKATVRFGIVSQAMEADAARRANAEASAAAMNAIRDMGIPDRHLRMEVLRLQPHRRYDRETRMWEEEGYEATRMLVVEVEDLELLPRVVAAVVARGANRLDGVTYGLKNRDAVRNDALVEAVRNARQKAELLVTTLGATLGDVQQINEELFDFPQPILQMQRSEDMAMKADAPEPDAYAAGEMEIRVRVGVTFRIR